MDDKKNDWEDISVAHVLHPPCVAVSDRECYVSFRECTPYQHRTSSRSVYVAPVVEYIVPVPAVYAEDNEAFKTTGRSLTK